MLEKSKNEHSCLTNFNPDVMLAERAYRDFFNELKQFDAGEKYENFNNFVFNDAVEYKNDGDGVTYIVWNILDDDNSREVVAYYTLAATAIPYEDRIRRDEDEAIATGEKYDSQICGIPALEIKMFAVAEKYQDVFYEYEGENLPISAWVMRNIIDYANSLLENVMGFKAVFLHSVPEAENFYLNNGFNQMKINMKPLHCIDSDYKAMYLSLKEVNMSYDE